MSPTIYMALNLKGFIKLIDKTNLGDGKDLEYF